MYFKPDTKTCTLNQIQRTTRTFRELMTEQSKPSKQERYIQHSVLSVRAKKQNYDVRRYNVLWDHHENLHP